ncbi:prepilin peptidase [Hippea alviniae]|uniref:prepilin peptidase n=1 Tax=Hippea alviniae TaxID=1279027 RepID=UPI0003B55545|nr:A24 family peptidase [Hippea alviniae]
MIYLVVFLFGLVIGSFLNVCIYRIPLGKSIVFPPSSCPVCDRRIKWYDNIPVISYILLGGRCRYCKSRISLVYPAVELLTAVITVGVYKKFGLDINTLFYLLFCYMLIVGSFVDFKHYIIPDRISLGLMVLGLVFGYFAHRFLFSLYGLVFGFALLYFVAVLGKLLFKKEAMGGGDIKLLGGIGAFVGIKGVLFVLFFSSLIGSLVGIALIIAKKTEMSGRIPFGPYLSFAALIYLFFGQQILRFLGYV